VVKRKGGGGGGGIIVGYMAEDAKVTG